MIFMNDDPIFIFLDIDGKKLILEFKDISMSI